MLRILGSACIAACLTLTPAWAEMSGTETYDLLFKNGTLDDVPRDAVLVYDREVTNAIKPDTGPRDTGRVVLQVEEGSAPTAFLRFEQGDKYRNLGKFPASVGNPMIMYFVETVARDMGESAGGSLFYIRNRIKDALVTPTDAVPGEAQFDGRTIATTSVTLRPFEGDPNVDRMQGFGDMAMTVTMSDEVPGWYHSLSAKASAYESVLTFETLEDAE
ncbi:hypothetical protein ACOXXX_12280 [Thalassococcus sp. BH17M4-6]|uniref:hypothetical protein n=1 Tax=Thalassococcus sp. BH17M4-6 TaxID=3413148 RepID=UPI003BD6341E